MILSLGVILNIFPILILINRSHSSLILKRISFFLLFLSSLFILDSFPLYTNLILFDGTGLLTDYKLIFILIILFLTSIILIATNKTDNNEYYLILLTNLVGIILLIISHDLVLTILSWELFNLSLYLLVGTSKSGSLSTSLKYFLLSALSTGLFFLGIFFIYLHTGSTQYDHINLIIQYDPMTFGPNLILASLLLKLAAAPIHNYAIDLYDSLPKYVSMYMMIIPKLSVLSLLYILGQIHLFNHSMTIIYISAILSLIIGSIGLISNLRLIRFLGYSGLNHLGFILIAYYCNDITSFIIYQILYVTSVAIIFLIIISLNHYKDTYFINQLAGLFKLNPLLSLAFSITILSLAGIPPLFGFFAKFFVITSLIHHSYYNIAILIVILSTISCARYLNLIKEAQFNLTPIINVKINPIISKIIATHSTILLFSIFIPLPFTFL